MRPSVTSTASAVPRSVFVMPTADGQGRDPFFPDASLQLAPAGPAVPEARTVELNLQGFSGEGSNRIAIINEQNFSAGDQAFVSTGGGRVIVHCIELKTNSVIVEVEGERRELRFHPNQR